MSYLIKFKVILIGLSLVLLTPKTFGADVTTVYFVPFEIETYVPITQETIISQAWEKWTISSKSKNSMLISLLKNGNAAKFDENRVRCLVISKNQNFLIDANGVVSTKEELGVRADIGKFYKFQDSLQIGQRKILKSKKY